MTAYGKENIVSKLCLLVQNTARDEQSLAVLKAVLDQAFNLGILLKK